MLISYAVTKVALDDTRAGKGPRFIEAQTYRLGAHTTSDDPTKYREQAEEDLWKERDPIARFEKFLRAKGESDTFFDTVKAEGEDLAADVRARVLALKPPPSDVMFDHVYTDDHPLISAQKAWLAQYEASFGGER